MDNELIQRPVIELLGESFFIPHYQRGYRWTKKQVEDLLDDIWSFTNKGQGEFYCLQPVVVRPKEWGEDGTHCNGWEVIDGQQRLTTIHIILNYLAKEVLKADNLEGDYGKRLYTICYETRPGSSAFLKNIISDNSNIDFHHVWKAYESVREWFSDGRAVKDWNDKRKFLATLLGKRTDDRSVQVIWYNVGASKPDDRTDADSIALFTRLNIGKIPLTNAELVKALFLSSSSFGGLKDEDRNSRTLQISLMWDDMENSLGDERFWAFITNAAMHDYPTRIELIFDLISGKGIAGGQVDPMHTFLYFIRSSRDADGSLWNAWLRIEQYYQTLCRWYRDRDLYHRIGYLIATGDDLGSLIVQSESMKKSEFELCLVKLVGEKVGYDIDIDELSYEDTGGRRRLMDVLLLLNVETVRANTSISEFFPFKSHKHGQWSLEHIHAQNAEDVDRNKKDAWHVWLTYHAKAIEDILKIEKDAGRRAELSGILGEIVPLAKHDKLTWEVFQAVANKTARLLSDPSGKSDDMHSISNLALLSQGLNSALSNSVFEVKRRIIIDMDKRGEYIPVCTRRVFLKYYTDAGSYHQTHFWSDADQEGYLAEIRRMLGQYISEEQPAAEPI